jgi:hypothetical protein
MDSFDQITVLLRQRNLVFVVVTPTRVAQCTDGAGCLETESRRFENDTSSNLSLSEQDHLNSNEQRLTTAAAIIRQDRANFHRFGLRDPADAAKCSFW